MYASVYVPSGSDGITVNAPGATVLLKGLTIKGTSGSLDGIQVDAVETLIVDNCFITGLGGYGIFFLATDSKLMIGDSKIIGCNQSGVYVSCGSGNTIVSINNAQMDYNQIAGLVIAPWGTGDIFATVTNSTANNNGGNGFTNVDISSGKSVLNLERCIASNNGSGIFSNNSQATDEIRLSNCTVTGNSNGVYKLDGSNGTISTRENNTVIGNTTNSNVTPNIFSAW
jgi:hypothetical protein